MTQFIKNNNNKKTTSSSYPTKFITTRKTTASTTAATATCSIRTEVNSLHKHPTTTITKERKNSTLSLLSNVDVVSSSSSAPISLFSMTEQQQPIQLTHITSVSASGSGRKVFRTMPSFKIMSYQNIIALLTVLVCGIVTVNGLKCYMCGQYNEGVGSITPCLNYSAQYAHLYLKECTKKSEKYCVKYVSELSIVRDCATECAEKEIWETQTYCCTEDGCNGSSGIEASAIVVILPLIIFMVNELMNMIKQQQRR